MNRLMKRTSFWILPLAVLSLIGVNLTEARDFKVYGYSTPHEGQLELVYWIDYFAKGNGDYSYFGRTVDKDGLWRHTVEVEYGVTDRWTLAYYADFEQPSGEDFKYVQSRAVFLRYRLFEPNKRFFDPAIYLEYYLPDHDYRGNEHLEARMILEKNMGFLQVRLNPILDKNLSGTGDVEEGLEFEYALGIYLKPLKVLQPGLEFYGEMGEVGDWKKLDNQEHFIFPTLKLKLPMRLEIETGIGFGLTADSDDLVVKGIFSYSYD
jgi:hypothetical protein